MVYFSHMVHLRLIVNQLGGIFYFPTQIIVLLDNQPCSILPVQKRYYFSIGIERKVLISKYSSSNFVMQI